MKALLTMLSLCLLYTAANAANLTATAVKAGAGKKNGKITLSVSGGNAPFTFSWTGPSGYTASWQNPDSLGAGTYCVTVTDRYCGKATLCISVGETPNSIKETSVNVSRIFPNPFTDQITIQPNPAMSGKLHATLFDISGRMIAERDLDAQVATNWSLSENLPCGSYLLLIQDEQGKSERALLIRQQE